MLTLSSGRKTSDICNIEHITVHGETTAIGVVICDISNTNIFSIYTAVKEIGLFPEVIFYLRGKLIKPFM